MPNKYCDYVFDNKEKLIRAVLDGYEIEEEYIEVSPIKAYELYFQGRQNVYCYNPKHLYYSLVTLSDFNPSVVKANGFKFYIEKRRE